MANARFNRELHQEFHNWIKGQKLKGVGTPDLTAGPAYIPQQRIDEYFKAGKNVAHILEGLDPDGNLKGYQELIVKSYPKVLCILLLLGRGHLIELFVHHNGLCDIRLPFDHRPAQFPVDDNGEDFFVKFKETQWLFCAQPLAYNMSQIYEDARVLPIMTKDQIGNGGSAKIFKIVLHQAYDELDPSINSDKKSPSSSNDWRYAHTYVLKTYHTRDAKMHYDNEVRAFRRVLAAGRKKGFVCGLIGFHGNFIHGGTHNVLLEYADKGSLEQYFKKVSPPTAEEDIVFFWRGLFDLMFALQMIHTLEDQDLETPNIFQGWHQDIKPDNILVVGSGRSSPYKYEFKLADLGLSHFKKLKPTDREVTDVDSYGTRTYGAPETYRSDNLVGPANLRVSKSVDIWSLGCVFSEAATWLVLGKDGLDRYREDRRKEASNIPGFKDDAFHNGETVLKSVGVTHANIMAAKRRSDHITRDVLYTLVQDMLEEKTMRPDANVLWKRSQRIHSKATGTQTGSIWTTSSESPISSRAPTLQESEIAGASSGRPTRAPNRRMSMPAGDEVFTDEERRRQSPDRMTEAAPDSASPSHTVAPSETHSSGRVSSSNGRLSDVKRHNPEIYWSVDSAGLWRDGQRKKSRWSKCPPQGGERYMEMINKRDHVFIVDDSASMRAREWPKLTARFSLLAYIVKTADDDGLDLYFSSSKQRRNSKKSSDLTRFVESRCGNAQGQDNLSTVLMAVLESFRRTMYQTASSSRKLFGMGPAAKKKPMTCYVLTDGAWCTDPTCDVRAVIEGFVDELLRKDADPKDFGIQFISFGDDQAGLAHLQWLDSDLGLRRDIVDTETGDGNVWKMLLGSINKQFDEDWQNQAQNVPDRSPSVRRSVHPPHDATSAFRSSTNV